MTPLPSLIPYLLLTLIFLLHSKDSNFHKKSFVSNKNINMILKLYILLFIIHTFWKLLFGIISLEILISSIIVYIFPLLFYFYFSKYGTEKELRSVLITISICGIISGLYFIYDSYSMFILRQVNEYSKQVIEYFAMRQPDQADPNISRMRVGYRSHGLLEKHSISTAWISMGCFSSISFLSREYIKTRIFIIFLFFSTLILSLNYSALAAFIFVILFIEYKGYLFMGGRFSKIGVKQIIFSITILFLLILMVAITSKDLFETIAFYTRYQVDLLLGDNLLNDDRTFIGSIIFDTINYPKHMLKFPPGILIGDGFSTGWGVYEDGGDFGLVESLHHLGLPFFIASIIGLFKLIKSALKNTHSDLMVNNNWGNYLMFAVCVIIYLFVSSIHYTTWATKSVFPIFMISIAIIPRYLYQRY